MLARRHRGRIAGFVIRWTSPLWLCLILAGTPRVAFADLCSLVTIHTGYLVHEFGEPASNDTLCFPDACGGYCYAEPWRCGLCLFADSTGYFHDTIVTLASLWNDSTAGGLGGDICYAYLSPCNRRECSCIGSWDGMEFPCPPPHRIVNTFQQNYNVDLYSIPSLSAPAYLYPPDFYSAPHSYMLYWTAVNSAASYDVQIDTALHPTFRSALWKDTSVPAHAVVIHDLPGRMTWRVRAVSGCSLSAWTSPAIVAGVDSDEGRAGANNPPSLTQNYPNPFNAATVIRFNLDATSDWSLIIHNILGQTVRRFAGGQAEGTQQIEWYGDDGIGNPMPSGIYFYRVETSRWTESRKMILLR